MVCEARTDPSQGLQGRLLGKGATSGAVLDEDALSCRARAVISDVIRSAKLAFPFTSLRAHHDAHTAFGKHFIDRSVT